DGLFIVLICGNIRIPTIIAGENLGMRFFAGCREYIPRQMIGGFQAFGQCAIRLTDRQPKCCVAVNPNFAKKYDPPAGGWRFFEANSVPIWVCPGWPYLCRAVSRMTDLLKFGKVESTLKWRGKPLCGKSNGEFLENNGKMFNLDSNFIFKLN